MSEKVEFIESYIKVEGGDYQWSDNHGELIRCRNCKYCGSETRDGVRFAKCELKHNRMPQGDWFCADGERREENESKT